MERKKPRWFRLFLRHFLWVPLIPMVTGLILLIVAQVLAAEAERLDRHGVETSARVLDREIDIRTDSNGDRHSYYQVLVTFVTQSGVPATAWENVRRETYEATQIGDTLRLRYVASDPTVIEIDLGSTAFAARLMRWIGAAVIAASLALAAFLGRRIPAALRALRDGAVRQARVETHEPTSVRINNRRQYRLTWTDAVGDTGKSGPHNPTSLPDIGSVIVVCVDPKTGRGWWEDDV